MRVAADKTKKELVAKGKRVGILEFGWERAGKAAKAGKDSEEILRILDDHSKAASDIEIPD